MALVSDNYITISIGKRANDPISEAYTTVLSELYGFLAQGFYLPPGYLVVGPGTNLHFSSKGEADLVEVYIVDIETGEETSSRTITLGSEGSYMTVPHDNVDLPYDLLIKVYDTVLNPDKGVTEKKLLSSYIIHVRNYAIPVMVQALEFLLYVYIPLYTWYLFQLKMFPVSIKSAVEDIVGRIISLPFEELPFTSDIYGLRDVGDLEEYFYPINPFDSFIEDKNLSRVLYGLLNNCTSITSVEEKFKKIFELSLYYLLYKNTVSSTSVIISTKYLFDFLRLVLDLVQRCAYGNSTTRLIDGFGVTTLPLLSIPQRFMLPFRDTSNSNVYNKLLVPPTWNLYMAYPGDTSLRSDNLLSVQVDGNSYKKGRTVVVWSAGGSGNGSSNYNYIDQGIRLPNSDNKLFYQFGYDVSDSASDCVKCAYYSDKNSGSYFVFFQQPTFDLKLKGDFKDKVIPKSSQEIEILPLYSFGSTIGIPNDVIESGVYCVSNKGVPLFSFISFSSSGNYTILFKNSGEGEDRGSQFILSSVETSSLKWVIFVHLFFGKNLLNNGNLSTTDADWKVMNIFLTTLSSVISNYFGMVEIWITPFYDRNDNGWYVFYDEFYLFTCQKVNKPYNTTMFFSIRLEDLLNVWS
jgi:hypothetical protein